MPRAPNNAARPVEAARRSWSPRRIQLPTNAIGHGITTVSSPMATPIAASRRPAATATTSPTTAAPRRAAGSRRGRGATHDREPELAWHLETRQAAPRRCGTVGWIALLPISRPTGQATAATRAPSTATLKATYSTAAISDRPSPPGPLRRKRCCGDFEYGDRRVEPVDHVGRGVARSVVDPGQRPRRRRVVAARDGGQPPRPRPSSRPVRVGRARRGRRPRRGCRRPSSTRRGRSGGGSSAHGDRLVLPRDRLRRLLAPGDRQQAHGGDAEQAEAVGEHLQPGQRRHDRRPGAGCRDTCSGVSSVPRAIHVTTFSATSSAAVTNGRATTRRSWRFSPGAWYSGHQRRSIAAGGDRVAGDQQDRRRAASPAPRRGRCRSRRSTRRGGRRNPRTACPGGSRSTGRSAT